MKYPQLVSMPSAVQDWLDEQLEARGIDAVVYTRYILSLLQKDTLDLTDDILTLSSNKGREVGRRGRKRGRRQEYWNVLDCEQLKRSAAVECLMSASDQKCGIEKLVDDLCAKLKEIQSEGETAADSGPPETSVPHQVTQSLQDQVQKYYAAFPPLSSKSSEGNNKSSNLVSDFSSVWGTKSISANLLCKNKTVTNSGVVNKGLGVSKSSVENKENQGNIDNFWGEVGKGNMKSRVQLRDKSSLSNKKGSCYSFAWTMSGEWGRSHSEMSVTEQDENCTSSGWLVSKYNSKNMESTSLTSDEAMVMENEDIWNVGVCRRLYQRHTESADILNLPQSKETFGYSDEDFKDTSDDTNLAQLIAKFDHSIEALWNPDDASTTDVSHNQSIKVDQNLAPGDTKIVSSPTRQLYNVEVKNWNNKQNYNNISCGNNSFIQCGTNITNSIWSDQVNQDNSVEGDEFAGDLNREDSANLVMFSDSESTERCFEENKDKYIINREGDDDQCNVLLEGDGKIVGHKSNSDHKQASKKFCSFEKSNINFKSLGSFSKFSNTIADEKSKVIWSKYENFPSFFSSFPFGGIDYPLEEFTRNLSNKKWSDVEDSADSYTNYDIFATYLNKPSSNMSILTDSIGSCSLNMLNHNREDSSFTEVIPKQLQVNSKSILQEGKLDSLSSFKSDLGKGADDFENVDKEEEDLLTSTRTHFRPIRQESLDSHNHAGCYADGTTFVIPNSLESITFKRSESGTLYLETEVGLDTPKKYMEYKEKEPYGGRHKFDEKDSNFVSSKLGSEFIPKFRVHQIEKCCQTEETEEMLLSDEEVDPKRSRQDTKTDSDFYFPGDELFAEKIINCLEDNDVSDCKTPPGNNDCKNVTKCTSLKNIQVTPESNSPLLEKLVEIPESSQQNLCKCNGNNNEATWKFSWPKSSGENTSICVWNSNESKPNHLSQSWYDIWSGGPGATATCQKCCSVINAGHSLQHRKLREELSQDGEQLLSDLSYFQHLYLGSDCWSDESAPPPSAEWEQMQGGSHTQNLQCLSPSADSCLDVQLYDDSGFMSKSPSHFEQALCGHDLNTEKKPLEELASTCSPKTFPLKIMFSMGLEREKEVNERPFSAKLVPKDRKRRHSGSQRPGSGQQPDTACRLPGELPTITCHIWATDPPCLKGTRNRSLRPVTL